MAAQEFDTVDVVRLEVETDPVGLVNLVQNPSGELGGWGWITPVAGSALAGGTDLVFSGVAGASWFTTEALPIASGQYAAARLTALSGTTVTHFRVRFEWLDAAGVLLSSAAQSGYQAVASPNVQYGPIVAPASTAYVRLRFDLFTSNTGTNPAGAHSFTFREVTVAKAATSGALGSVRTNLVANPSFETSTAGWSVSGPAAVRTNLVTNPSFETNTTGWTAAEGTTMFSRVSGIAGSTGIYCLEFGPPIGTTRGYAKAPTVAVTPGESYVISLRQRTFPTASGGVRYRWLDSGGVQIGADVHHTVALPGTHVWTDYSLVAVAPAGAATLAWWVFYDPSDPGARLTHVDAVMVERATAAGTYFDGSTADAGGWDYAWTGTAHASTSTATKVGVTASTASPAGVPVGTKALAITLDPYAPAGTVTATGSSATITPSASYAAQVKVMSPVATTAWFQWRWETAGGAFLGTSSTTPVPLAAGVWTTISNGRSAWAAAGRVTAQVLFDSPGAGAVHYVDAVMIEQAATVNTYFDGNTPDAGGVDYAWVGTANESQSTATTSNLAFVEPVQYLNVIGESHQIRVSRKELNAGHLNATILSSALDPSQSTLIRPGRRARLAALADGTWEPLIGGKLLEADVTYTVKDPAIPEEKRARIEVVLIDPAQVLANAGRPEGVATIDELPFVLEGAGVPWNVNGSGNQVPTADVTTYNDGAKALDQVALTRDTAIGYAWMSRVGVLNVWDRDLIASGSPVLLDEDDYSDIDLSFSTKDAINEVQITVQSLGADGSTVETVYGPYTDAASIAEWGRYRKEFTVTGLDAAQVDALAAAILAANVTPRIRVNSITIPIHTQARIDAHALRDLYDEVNAVLTSLGVDDLLRVTGIEHTITTDKWLLRLDFSDEGGVASPTIQPPVQSGARPDVGVIELFAGPAAAVPATKLLCNGASYATADYPHLFAVIGYTFGGSGAFFNVPNLTDRFPIGSGTKALGTTGGASTHTHGLSDAGWARLSWSTAGQILFRRLTAGIGAWTATVRSSSGTAVPLTADSSSSNTAAIGLGGATDGPSEGLPPWLSLNYVIRAA